VSEARGRRRGRGLDAIFDQADLDLGEHRREPQETTEPVQDAEPGAERRRPSVRERRRPGRPRNVQPPRELVQRGFYLEPEQDRMLDELKANLKGRDFTPDRSAIIRAAVEHFYALDAFEQEELVRRAK
jgi:hypothetical protein